MVSMTASPAVPSPAVPPTSWVGAGLEDLPKYVQCNFLGAEADELCAPENRTAMEEEPMHVQYMEQIVSTIVPFLFGIIVIVGLFGNALVVLVVAANQQMRNTTNLLIINLAVADLLFIVFCVPFTATDYALPFWPFGDTWCKIVQYLIVVTSMASVYTLVLMSLDRFLAVVYPIASMSVRTERNTLAAIGVMWVVILVTSIPAYVMHGVVAYNHDSSEHTACVFLDLQPHSYNQPGFRIRFFLTAYVVPLLLIMVLYVLMLTRLWRGSAPGGRCSAESRRGKKRVTRMVVVVVAIFAISWAPIQIILVLKSVGLYDITVLNVVLQIASQTLAYMNSCVNPILYAFLSENFRKAFRKIVFCRSQHQPEERNGRIANEKATRTGTTRTNGSSHDVL